ncbi:hypothetical protein [Halosimplex marinum]|uniref:hypothetical protein n=1 Tax=Halosimplex marinum TaxID=3396620 RepID=UPI003F5636B7
MERRRFLTTSSFGVLAGLTGCLNGGRWNAGTDTWSPEIEGTEPTLSFADESPLTVEASDVAGLTVRLPDPQFIAFRFRNADWSPNPASVSDSYPPQWAWSPARSVSGEIPIQIGDHAEPGEYTYGVEAVADSRSDDRSAVETFTITITGE